MTQVNQGLENQWVTEKSTRTHEDAALPGSSTQQVAGNRNESNLQKPYQFQLLEKCSHIQINSLVEAELNLRFHVQEWISGNYSWYGEC